MPQPGTRTAPCRAIPRARRTNARRAVAVDHRQPGPAVARGADDRLGVMQQRRGDPRSAGDPVDVDLLDLVAVHHRETDDAAADSRDPRLREPFPCARQEGFARPMPEQLVGHVAEMPIAPPHSPDLGDATHVACPCRLDRPARRGMLADHAAPGLRRGSRAVLFGDHLGARSSSNTPVTATSMMSGSMCIPRSKT